MDAEQQNANTAPLTNSGAPPKEEFVQQPDGTYVQQRPAKEVAEENRKIEWYGALNRINASEYDSSSDAQQDWQTVFRMIEEGRSAKEAVDSCLQAISYVKHSTANYEKLCTIFDQKITELADSNPKDALGFLQKSMVSAEEYRTKYIYKQNPENGTQQDPTYALEETRFNHLVMRYRDILYTVAQKSPLAAEQSLSKLLENEKIEHSQHAALFWTDFSRYVQDVTKPGTTERPPAGSSYYEQVDALGVSLLHLSGKLSGYENPTPEDKSHLQMLEQIREDLYEIQPPVNIDKSTDPHHGLSENSGNSQESKKIPLR